jgi:hypothetical protein
MKKNTFNNRQNVILLFSIILLFPLFAVSQPDIPIDTYLKNNSESWKVKIKQKGITGNKPAEINFGPLKTIQTEAGKAQLLDRNTDRDLFWKNIKTVKSRESIMILTYNETDTILINMLTVTEEIIHKKNLTGTIFSSNKNQDDKTYTSSSWADEMSIKLQNDTTQWRFTKTDTSFLSKTEYIGKLYSVTDSFLIKPIDNLTEKQTKNIMFGPLATGFVFLHDGKQVAAFQTLMKKNIWISKEINTSTKQVLLAATAAMLATIKTENSNGF